MKQNPFKNFLKEKMRKKIYEMRRAAKVPTSERKKLKPIMKRR